MTDLMNIVDREIREMPERQKIKALKDIVRSGYKNIKELDAPMIQGITYDYAIQPSNKYKALLNTSRFDNSMDRELYAYEIMARTHDLTSIHDYATRVDDNE